MENRITALIGISGSGKSTWAHEQWLENPDNTVIVNRDKIREGLFSFTEDSIHEYYRRDDLYRTEKLVTRFEDTLINESLQMGKDVIIDATHLKRGYLDRFSYWNVSTTYKLFPVTLKEAEVRDMSRKRSVGPEIIQKQYNNLVSLYNNLKFNPIKFEVKTIDNNPSKPDAVIFDIDGTIAKMGDRSPYDWKRVGVDTVDESTVKVMDMIKSSGTKVIICTGRDGIALYTTKLWLEVNKINYDEILIRPEGDSRPDWVVKEEMWREIAKDNYIVGMFDDRLQVVRRARSLGLKVFNVEYNNF